MRGDPTDAIDPSWLPHLGEQLQYDSKNDSTESLCSLQSKYSDRFEKMDAMDLNESLRSAGAASGWLKLKYSSRGLSGLAAGASDCCFRDCADGCCGCDLMLLQLI